MLTGWVGEALASAAALAIGLLIGIERGWKLRGEKPGGHTERSIAIGTIETAIWDALAKIDSNVPFMMPKRIAETDAFKQIDSQIGSGPFVYVNAESKPGEKHVYTKNAKYKPRSEPASGLAGGKVVKVDRVEWIAMPDVQTRPGAAMVSDASGYQMRWYRLHVPAGAVAPRCRATPVSLQKTLGDLTSRLVRLTPDMMPAVTLPRWLSGMKLSKIGSSLLQNSRL